MNWILIPDCLVSKLENTIFKPLVHCYRYAFPEIEDTNLHRPRAVGMFVAFSGTGNVLGGEGLPENEPRVVAFEKTPERDEDYFNTV